MKTKLDKELVEKFPKKEMILRQIMRQVRHTFSQNLGSQNREKERVSATCTTIVSAFQLYLTQLTQAERRKLLYKYFIDELSERMPELGLGYEVKHNSWQCILEPLIDGIIHSD